MNVSRLKDIGNRILEKGVIVSNFTGDLNLEIHKEKISEALLNQVKALPKVQRDFLTLYIESKVDSAIEKTNKKLDEIKQDIQTIKEEIGCNGGNKN